MIEQIISGDAHFERRRVSFTSLGEATEYVLDNPVPNGKVFVVIRISIVNETTAYAQLRFGTLKTTVFQPVEEEKNPAVGTLYILSEEIFAFGGEQVGCEVLGCVAGDKINMYLEGYWFNLK